MRPLYLTYKLNYRDLVAMMAERDVAVSHTTVMRWVQRYVPKFERRWAQFSRPTGSSWRMDENNPLEQFTGIHTPAAFLFTSV